MLDITSEEGKRFGLSCHELVRVLEDIKVKCRGSIRMWKKTLKMTKVSRFGHEIEGSHVTSLK